MITGFSFGTSSWLCAIGILQNSNVVVAAWEETIEGTYHQVAEARGLGRHIESADAQNAPRAERNAQLREPSTPGPAS